MIKALQTTSLLMRQHQRQLLRSFWVCRSPRLGTSHTFASFAASDETYD